MVLTLVATAGRIILVAGLVAVITVARTVRAAAIALLAVLASTLRLLAVATLVVFVVRLVVATDSLVFEQHLDRGVVLQLLAVRLAAEPLAVLDEQCLRPVDDQDRGGRTFPSVV
jgi:hypothetical protein